MSFWTPQDIDRLRALHASPDYSDDAAGVVLRRSPRGVALKRHKLNLVARRCCSRIRSASSEDLAAELRRRGFAVTELDEEPTHSGVCTL